MLYCDICGRTESADDDEWEVTDDTVTCEDCYTQYTDKMIAYFGGIKK